MWYWSATGGCSPRRASARICSRIEGLDWITALGAPAIQALVTSGAVQLSLFEQQEGAAMTDLGHRGQALNFPPCRWIMTTCGSPTQRTLLRRRSGAAECDDLDRSGYTGADGTVAMRGLRDSPTCASWRAPVRRRGALTTKGGRYR